jgi:RNA polymerase sigma-70 factor (ECF subfamily)
VDDKLCALIPRLRRFALSLTREEASADDLVQSCLERALTKRDTRRADGDLRSWLFSILYRQFLDNQRRQQRYRSLLKWFVDTEQTVSPSTEEVTIAHSMLSNFNKLADEQRALLTLVAVEGMSYREISDTLKIPIGTVMSRLSRARAALVTLTEGEVVSAAARLRK